MSEIQEDSVKALHTVFHEGLDLYNQITNNNAATNSPEVQRDVKKSIKIFEDATRLVSLADIFSTNESIEEITTNNIQYLLLPALLGLLTLKITTRDRKEVLDVAEIYFRDFLQRTNDYELSNYEFEKKKLENNQNKTEFEQIEQAVNTRSSKIQRFQQKKELQSQLENLKKNVENEFADEDIKRNYFLTMVKVFIHDVVDELASIDMEKPILEHMAKIKKDEAPKPKRAPPPPLKPIIITRDETQKAIYGAGYPSLPTMTVQEFYDKRVADGIFPDPNKPKTGPLSLQEAALAGVEINNEDTEAESSEKKIEEDDEEEIQRIRAKDEYKDDHRRGWGNRMNRS
ncbi:immunoglobulin-binding protein 1 [Sitophilus oryzae]|uniref:Immunoglobulin-binding protein 1 n=1 Tax=Sitophilus oryzae TaxID=7048 RepID=A0A6J2XZ25_SITOR|nr:immunoglobulin-binding protein 1 [Sitophilus oryzae]